MASRREAAVGSFGTWNESSMGTMVQMRRVFEAAGASLSWSDAIWPNAMGGVSPKLSLQASLSIRWQQMTEWGVLCCSIFGASISAEPAGAFWHDAPQTAHSWLGLEGHLHPQMVQALQAGFGSPDAARLPVSMNSNQCQAGSGNSAESRSPEGIAGTSAGDQITPRKKGGPGRLRGIYAEINQRGVFAGGGGENRRTPRCELKGLLSPDLVLATCRRHLVFFSKFPLRGISWLFFEKLPT